MGRVEREVLLRYTVEALPKEAYLCIRVACLSLSLFMVGQFTKANYYQHASPPPKLFSRT
jgi:hypothetical protein